MQDLLIDEEVVQVGVGLPLGLPSQLEMKRDLEMANGEQAGLVCLL